jgi:alkaline phosphatase
MNEKLNATAASRRSLLKLAGLGLLGSTACGRTNDRHPVSKSNDKVRGVIFMISDGMSPGVLTLAQAFSKLTRGKDTTWWNLHNSPKVVRGLMDTASANSLVTDSAAASSAWGGGQRVHNGTINVTAQGNPVEPIASVLKKRSSANIGLVTTATVTHATPAGFAASAPKRADQDHIAPQYLGRADIILGGGQEFFDPELRGDHRDLFGEFQRAGHHCLQNRESLLTSKSAKLLGTFRQGHLPFSIDRNADPRISDQVPTLSEMAQAALSRLLADTRPFLLQIEGARIDHAAHLNDIGALLHDQLAFDDAISTVLTAVANHPEVLVVVTSDHGNSNPGLNGMGDAYAESTQHFSTIRLQKASHERIFHEWKQRNDGSGEAHELAKLIQEHLSIALDAEEAEALRSILNKGKPNEWNHLLAKPEGLLGQFAGNHTGVGWTGTTHTSDPTLISAIGPQADRFGGIVTNSDVFGHFVDMLG